MIIRDSRQFMQKDGSIDWDAYRIAVAEDMAADQKFRQEMRQLEVDKGVALYECENKHRRGNIIFITVVVAIVGALFGLVVCLT